MRYAATLEILFLWWGYFPRNSTDGIHRKPANRKSFRDLYRLIYVFLFFPLLSVAPSAEEKVNGPQNGLAHPPDAFLPPSLLMLSVLNFNLIWKKNLIWFIIPPRDGVASWASEISEILKIRHRTFDGLGQTLIFWRQNTRIDIKHFVHCWRITTNQRSGNFRLKRGKSAAINGVQVP